VRLLSGGRERKVEEEKESQANGRGEGFKVRAFEGIWEEHRRGTTGEVSHWIALVFQSSNSPDRANQMPQMRINLQLLLGLGTCLEH